MFSCRHLYMCICLLVMLIGGIGYEATHAAPVPKVVPDVVPADVVTKYKELGGVFGILYESPFVGMRFRPIDEDHDDDPDKIIPGVQTFQFRDFPDKAMPKVPVRFGIRITNCEVPDKSTLNFLKHCDTLVALSLAETDCGDDHISSIAGHKGISYLDLSTTKISDNGLRQLVRFPHLTRLSLSHMTAIRDGSLASITNHPSLIALTLDRTAVTDAGIKYLPKKIEYLSLSGTKISDNALRNLFAFQSLREIHLAETPITDKGLRELAKCQAIDSIDLHRTSISGNGLAILSNFKNLKKLRISQTKSIDGISNLTNVGNFTHLSISDTLATDEDIKLIGNNNNLQYLSIANTKITDKSIRHIITCKSLRYLNIRWCAISADAIKLIRVAIPDCYIIDK